jgi:hypothetical protein
MTQMVVMHSASEMRFGVARWNRWIPWTGRATLSWEQSGFWHFAHTIRILSVKGCFRFGGFDSSPVLGLFDERLFQTAKGTDDLVWDVGFYDLNRRRFCHGEFSSL